MNSTHQRVAVLGASGIGRHHANWWTVEGAEVCAFLGRGPASVAATREKLQGMFGFAGRGYTNLRELLVAEKPDIVDVCTPPDCHSAHVRAALEAGCRVLCEKPFVYDSRETHGAMLADGRALVADASRRGLLLGLCSQYHPAAELCAAIWRRETGNVVPSCFRGILVSPTRGRSPDPVRTWVDLAPHMIAALQAIVPDGVPDPGSLETEFRGHRARAFFLLRRPDGTTVRCEILTNHTDDEPVNVRRLEFDDFVCDIGGGRDENGHFCLDVGTAAGVFRHPDSMRLLVRRFLAGEAVVDGAAAVTNLERMLQVIHRARS